MSGGVDSGAAMAVESGSHATGDHSRSSGHHMLRGGLPRYAEPWMEMGKLRERERWQGFTAQLLKGAIAFELDDLKRRTVEVLSTPSSAAAVVPQSGLRSSFGRPLSSIPRSAPSIPSDLKQNLSTAIDSSKARISSILADYIKFFTSDTKTMHGEDAMVLDKLSPTSNEEQSLIDNRPKLFQSLGLFFGSMIIMRFLAYGNIVL
ncbi:hypothetical protein GOP47_0008335 [Adiantum capillus-veneris]|uniref:Uncharacterized protein n=1 Tax=Adiantum capillus-veneris TaxID=13818 RepID=A0A9D4ZKK8_ADICA|nr:hypothetical protein GOP47_0008335 [Adiantum capillus-veneris]